VTHGEVIERSFAPGAPMEDVLVSFWLEIKACNQARWAYECDSFESDPYEEPASPVPAIAALTEQNRQSWLNLGSEAQAAVRKRFVLLRSEKYWPSVWEHLGSILTHLAGSIWSSHREGETMQMVPSPHVLLRHLAPRRWEVSQSSPSFSGSLHALASSNGQPMPAAGTWPLWASRATHSISSSRLNGKCCAS